MEEEGRLELYARSPPRDDGDPVLIFHNNPLLQGKRENSSKFSDAPPAYFGHHLPICGCIPPKLLGTLLFSSSPT